MEIRFRRLGVDYELWQSGNLTGWNMLPVAASGPGVEGTLELGPPDLEDYFEIRSRFVDP